MRSRAEEARSSWINRVRSTIGIVALTVPVFLSLVSAPWLKAQAPTEQPPSTHTTVPQAAQGRGAVADRPTFDAISIKLSKSAVEGGGIRFQPGGRLVTNNLPVRLLIATAYKIPLNFAYGGIIGVPESVDSKRYDVETEADGNPPHAQVLLMMQSLLADRFKLALHMEIRQLPVYALVVSKPGKTGQNLVVHAADNSTCRDLKAQPLAPPQAGIPPPRVPISCGGFLVSPGRFTTGTSTMADLAKNLSFFQQIDRSVVDKTGLSGTFDLAIDYAPFVPVQVAADSGTTDSALPSTIFEALQQQLGLKLISQTGPVDVMIIDHIEEPTPN